MFQSVFTDELAIGFMEALDALASWGLKHVDLRGGVFGRSFEALTRQERRHLLDFHEQLRELDLS